LIALEAEPNPASKPGHPQWSVRISESEYQVFGIIPAKINKHKERRDPIPGTKWIFINVASEFSQIDAGPIRIRRDMIADPPKNDDGELISENYRISLSSPRSHHADLVAKEKNEEDRVKSPKKDPEAPIPSAAVADSKRDVTGAASSSTPGEAEKISPTDEKELQAQIGYHYAEIHRLLKALHI